MRGVVSVPVCPLMTTPGPDGTLADQALLGTEVTVLEETTSQWRRVRTAYRYEGYAPADCLETGGAAEDWLGREKGVIRWRNAAPVLDGPDYRAGCRHALPLGAVVAVAEERDGWREVRLPDGGVGYVRASVLSRLPSRPSATPEGELRQRLVEAALRYRYAPYRWGGKTPQGIDCSGLVFMAYWLCGMTIYRDARLEPGYDLVEIRRGEMRPGDLLFFPGHVAMYLGDGQYLHATGRAGSDGVDVNSLKPGRPRYRPDLAESVLYVGSYRGFH